MYRGGEGRAAGKRPAPAETVLEEPGRIRQRVRLRAVLVGTFPCAVFSQIERLDFTGKRVFPVMTHEGSGLGRCEQDLKALCTGAVLGEGLAVLGSRAAESGEQIAQWARKAVNNS